MRYVFYNQQINKVTHHFILMPRAQNADTHALKQPRLSQYISPVSSSFALVIASDMHLESDSEKRSKLKQICVNSLNCLGLSDLYWKVGMRSDLGKTMSSLCHSPRAELFIFLHVNALY